MMQQLVQLLGYGLNDQTFDSLQGQRFFFVRCVFLWWWPWRLLSCMMVTPCSLVMCEYSVYLLLCL